MISEEWICGGVVSVLTVRLFIFVLDRKGGELVTSYREVHGVWRLGRDAVQPRRVTGILIGIHRFLQV